MAQLDERGEKLYEQVEESGRGAAEAAGLALEQLGLYIDTYGEGLSDYVASHCDVLDADAAATYFAEAARMARKAADAQRRLDDL